MHGTVLAAGAAVAASLLVTARRRRQRDDASTCRKPPMPSVEVPLRAETPRKALLGGDDEHWEEQPNEHGKSAPPPPPILAVAEVAIEEVARLKARLEQLAFENESLHHLNERLLKAAHKPEASPGSSLSPSMLTGATEEASSVDRPPLATTRPSLASPAADERTAHVTATASGRLPAGLALGGPQLAERLFRAHARAAREGQLRLCLFAMREHARRRGAERRFQGLLALKVVEVEEAQAEAQVAPPRPHPRPSPSPSPRPSPSLSPIRRRARRRARRAGTASSSASPTCTRRCAPRSCRRHQPHAAPRGAPSCAPRGSARDPAQHPSCRPPEHRLSTRHRTLPPRPHRPRTTPALPACRPRTPPPPGPRGRRRRRRTRRG